jgi:UDP-N-acetylmuramoylalanine--D-glutamate ligase
MEIADRKISIIGAFRSGIGAAKLVKKLGGRPFVSDSGDGKKFEKQIKALKENGFEYEVGNHSEKVFNCDLMVVSPGVPSDAKVIVAAREKKIKVVGEIELASAFCKGNIIAITGTNGKTTTTSLCGHLLKTCGARTYVAGNIGDAFSEVALDVKENEFVALEVSSFQLDMIDEFKPKIAAILNITPDHLNRYENKFENYIYSKFRIFKNQDDSDYLLLNKDDKTISKFVSPHESHDFYFSLNEKLMNGCFRLNEKVIFNKNGKSGFECEIADIFIPGEHNVSNAMSAISALKIFNFDNEKIIEGLRTFKGVEHRLEFVRELEGVKYINDSKATNVDSVWYALRSFKEPIFLILGGQDKGNDYNQIKELVLENVKKIFAIGSSADKVFNFFHHDVKVEIKKSLQDAVLSANNEAREGEIVLLSPACASFDQFDNYEHRGRVFKESVDKL